MELRQDLSPALRRRFQTGRICLDLTHTGGEGDFARWELFHRPADVSRYLGIIVGCDVAPPTRREFSDLHSLRHAITIAARTLAAGTSPFTERLAAMNEAAVSPSLIPQLVGEDRTVLLPGTTTAALSTIARDAIDVFSSPLAGQIRICAAEDCGLLFVDASRPGNRRWCSMQWCGDRSKKRVAGRPVPKVSNHE
jgi:predicted RNA-binding Zn ribbon-like protein